MRIFRSFSYKSKCRYLSFHFFLYLLIQLLKFLIFLLLLLCFKWFGRNKYTAGYPLLLTSLSQVLLRRHVYVGYVLIFTKYWKMRYDVYGIYVTCYQAQPVKRGTVLKSYFYKKTKKQ